MRIELHQIARCGFYERAQPKPLFGHPSDWGATLPAWVRTRANVAATTTFDAVEGQPTVYCAACVEEDEGFGLVLWHSMPATESGVAYIPMAASPNAVAASEERLPEHSIPGWPSYFWVLPAARRIVVLHPTGKIRNRGTGLPAVRDYLRAFLERFSPFVALADAGEPDPRADASRAILGWRAHPTHVPRNDLRVRFDTRPVEVPCVLDAIRQRCADIRKLIHSVQVTHALPVERARLEQLLSISGWSTPYRTPEQDRLSFRWESDWQPSPDELDELIAEAQRRQPTPERRDRAGVRFVGDDRVHWLDTESVRDEVLLPEPLENALTWSQEQLRQAWSRSRSTVMARLGTADVDA